MPREGFRADMAARPVEKGSTFREWLAGRSPSEKDLSDYISALGEWWKSELKAASEDTDYALRKTVCAFANTEGGEIFVGVGNDRAVTGTTLTDQRLAQVLRQEKGPRGEWYVVDLTRPVRNVTPVAVGPTSTQKQAYVLEVARVGLPVFLLEKDGELSLYVRQGESSIRANSFSALAWNRGLNRQEILRTCYLEMKTLSRAVGEASPGIAVGLALSLPYFTKRLEDGTIYRYLTDDDLVFLIGRAHGNGYEGGNVRDVFETRHKLDMMQRQGMNRGEEYRELDDILRSAHEDMTRRADDLKGYLKSQGIATD